MTIEQIYGLGYIWESVYSHIDEEKVGSHNPYPHIAKKVKQAVFMDMGGIYRQDQS